jgi:predicted P-loop ATPase
MNDRLSSLTEADRAAFKASQRDERARARAPREARSGEPTNNQAERPTKRTKAKNVPHKGWQASCIVDDRGRIVANLANVMIALRADPSIEGAFAFDEMAQAAKLLKRLPVAPDGQHAGTDPVPRLVRDEDVSQLQEWLQHRGMPRIVKDTVHQAVDQRARERFFHPVREWLDNLRWDETKRLSGWLQTYLGATGPQDYLAAIGPMFLIAMVARIFKPGCKVDYMLVLGGEQGVEKSKACAVLAGQWFSDGLPDIHDKDARQHLCGKWLVEIAELAAFTRAESEALKAFITRDHERYRPSYGRKDVVEPRQCVFIGTTNRSVYIKDETGGRRFWPVAVDHVNVEALARDRDQLFAEAVVCFRRGESWWPDPVFERLHIKPEQDSRYESDPWDEDIAAFVANRDRVTVAEIARQALHFEAIARVGTHDQRRVVAILTKLGWEQGRRTGKGRWYTLKVTQ